MRNHLASRLFSPPIRLRPLPERWTLLVRPLWILALLVSAGIVAAGTVYALRDIYEVRPAFSALGLEYDVGDDHQVWVESATGDSIAESRILAIAGRPVDSGTRVGEVARRLQAVPGPTVAVDLADHSGQRSKLQLRRGPPPNDQAAKRTRDFRVAARLASALLACVALLLCAFLLGRRRPNDPVAMLFAFAFAGMAATIDPPLAMWMALGWPIIYDIVSSAWFYLLLIALAVFPDGIFVPKIYRWLLIAGLPLAVFVSLPDVNEGVQVFAGVGALLAMLVGQVVRYRRERGGIERQQIKWAGFGFAVGLLLVGAAFVVLLVLIPDNAGDQNPWVNLAALLLFSLGMAAIPFGLLVALVRFRLWEADTVITRSAAYAVVTLIVGVVWAASSDLVKLIITEVMGRQSEAGATTVGAIIAAGIFSPTQSLVLGWTRRRFGGPLDRIEGAAERLKAWGLAETPPEVARRALELIDRAIHPSAAAIVVDDELLAALGAESAADPQLIERLPLADDEGEVGTLLIGRRSDGNRYSRQELEAVRRIIPSLAEALRVSRSRHSRESMLQRQLEEMASRLAQLEGGAPKPA